MLPAAPLKKAARIILSGGVVAYPTEGVYGLGCMPQDEDAVIRILSIKQRRPSKGLILIASNLQQLADWTDLPGDVGKLTSGASGPVTWAVPAAKDVPYWIQGDHGKIAVRITQHPVAAALCDAADSALVSTSANVSGRPPARNRQVLRRTMGHLVDYIVPGPCGPLKGHSEIRDFESGSVLRAATS
jgi:L-threonylcarbamoyladenylate synthase